MPADAAIFGGSDARKEARTEEIDGRWALEESEEAAQRQRLSGWSLESQLESVLQRRRQFPNNFLINVKLLSVFSLYFKIKVSKLFYNLLTWNWENDTPAITTVLPVTWHSCTLLHEYANINNFCLAIRRQRAHSPLYVQMVSEITKIRFLEKERKKKK